MPLNKPPGYLGRELDYQTKVSLVEDNCAGCPFFIFEMGSHDDITIGCIFPSDIKDFNEFIREPYLTVEEIASNTCEFWSLIPEFHKIDSSPDPTDIYGLSAFQEN